MLGWEVLGHRGLLSSMKGKPWFPLQDSWNNSKSAAMPMVLLAYDRSHPSGPVERAIDLTGRFLVMPSLAATLGVMVPEPDLPWGGHSPQSWAVCSVAATGLAGMTIAEMAQAGTIYPVLGHEDRRKLRQTGMQTSPDGVVHRTSVARQ